MYLDFKVKIPSDSAGITRKKIKGTTYIYYAYEHNYSSEKGYKWYNKNVQKIQNKNIQLIYCYPGGKQYDFTKQHYYKLRN